MYRFEDNLQFVWTFMRDSMQREIDKNSNYYEGATFNKSLPELISVYHLFNQSDEFLPIPALNHKKKKHFNKKHKKLVRFTFYAVIYISILFIFSIEKVLLICMLHYVNIYIHIYCFNVWYIYVYRQ